MIDLVMVNCHCIFLSFPLKLPLFCSLSFFRPLCLLSPIKLVFVLTVSCQPFVRFFRLNINTFFLPFCLSYLSLLSPIYPAFLIFPTIFTHYLILNLCLLFYLVLYPYYVHYFHLVLYR